MTGSAASWNRIVAVAWKDAAELARNPGAVWPAVAMVFGSILPAFAVVVGAPMVAGETLASSGDFLEGARAATIRIPELTGLSGNGLIQAYLFHQFALLLLLVPIVGATALATHAVIGEKQSKALEPLLATPLSTLELLAAKTLTPFVFALLLTWVAAALYVGLAGLVGEPGVWRALLGVRTFLMFVVLGPLVELAALQVSVIVSSRTNDTRSAQQLSSLLVLPVTAVFIAQLGGALFVGPAALALGAVACGVFNGVLLWIGVRVFQRERILMRWR